MESDVAAKRVNSDCLPVSDIYLGKLRLMSDLCFLFILSVGTEGPEDIHIKVFALVFTSRQV